MATTIIISHKVENYEKWKPGFDAGEGMRAQAGINIKGVYQSADDQNQVTIIAEAPNADVVRAVLSSPEMKAGMEKGGVISVPEVKYLNLAN